LFVITGVLFVLHRNNVKQPDPNKRKVLFAIRGSLL
jgi:hypothetical protein